MTDKGRGVERLIAACFAVTLLAAVGLGATYWRGGHTQAEGAFLGIALGGLALGLTLWARYLLPQEDYVEEHEHFEPSEVAGELLRSGGEEITRRRFLSKLLIGAAGALGLVVLFPLRSLGPRPGRTPFTSAFREGVRLVTEDGRPVRMGDLPVGSVVTVFPEGHTDVVNSQTLLIHVDPRDVRAAPGREGWVVDGHIAYSKLCTHAACPVGLYKPDTNHLFCPCHQSVFDVLDGARVLAGPAARPLPQLPLAVDDAGFIVAADDYPEPIGPSFWERS